MLNANKHQWNLHDAVSAKGARSAWQIIPATAQRLGVDPANPYEAAEGGLRLLRDNYQRFRPRAKNDLHGWMMSVGAYHAGEEAVERDLAAGGVGIPNTSDGLTTTRRHVADIFKNVNPALLDRAPQVGVNSASNPTSAVGVSNINTQSTLPAPAQTNAGIPVIDYRRPVRPPTISNNPNAVTPSSPSALPRLNGLSDQQSIQPSANPIQPPGNTPAGFVQSDVAQQADKPATGQNISEPTPAQIQAALAEYNRRPDVRRAVRETAEYTQSVAANQMLEEQYARDLDAYNKKIFALNKEREQQQQQQQQQAQPSSTPLVGLSTQSGGTFRVDLRDVVADDRLAEEALRRALLEAGISPADAEAEIAYQRQNNIPFLRHDAPTLRRKVNVGGKGDVGFLNVAVSPQIFERIKERQFQAAQSAPGSIAAREAERESVRTPFTAEQERILDDAADPLRAVGSAAKGAFGLLSGAMRGVASYEDAADANARLLGYDGADLSLENALTWLATPGGGTERLQRGALGERPQESAAYILANSFDDNVLGNLPELKAPLARKIAQGFGSGIGFLLLGALTGSVGAAALGALAGRGELYQQAVDARLSRGKRLAAATGGELLGATEFFGLGSALSRTAKAQLARGFGDFLLKSGKATTKETFNEGFQEWIQSGGGNAWLAYLKSNEPDNYQRIKQALPELFSRDSLESAGIGALTGGVLGGGANVIGEARVGRRERARVLRAERDQATADNIEQALSDVSYLADDARTVRLNQLPAPDVLTKMRRAGLVAADGQTLTEAGKGAAAELRRAQEAAPALAEQERISAERERQELKNLRAADAGELTSLGLENRQLPVTSEAEARRIEEKYQSIEPLAPGASQLGLNEPPAAAVTPEQAQEIEARYRDIPPAARTRGILELGLGNLPDVPQQPEPEQSQQSQPVAAAAQQQPQQSQQQQSQQQQPPQSQPQQSAPVPESAPTLELQRQSAENPASPRAGVLYTPGEKIPPARKGEWRLKTKDGLLSVDKQKMASLYGIGSMKEFAAFVKSDENVQRILGRVETVGQDTQNAPAAVLTTKQGVEVNASAITSPAAAAAQIEADRRAFPGSTSSVVAPQDVVAQRLAALSPVGDSVPVLGMTPKKQLAADSENALKSIRNTETEGNLPNEQRQQTRVDRQQTAPRTVQEPSGVRGSDGTLAGNSRTDSGDDRKRIQPSESSAETGRIEAGEQSGERRLSDAESGKRPRSVAAQGTQGQPGRPQIEYGEGGKPGAKEVDGFHYSQEKRDRLDSARYGSGMPGAERRRVENSTDPRLKHRIHFYLNTGKGITPEEAVGTHLHGVRLKDLYDADADKFNLKQKHAGNANAFESAILDAGYQGYFTRSFGTRGIGVLLGERQVPVEYFGETGQATQDVGEVLTAPQQTRTPAKEARQAVLGNRNWAGRRFKATDWRSLLEEETPDAARMFDSVLADLEQNSANDYFAKDEIVRRFDEKYQYPATALNLEGIPARQKVDGVTHEFGAFRPAHEAARSYMEQAGLQYEPATRWAPIDKDRARRIAEEFERMEHNPQDPEVKAAYEAMIRETLAQWEAIKKTGLTVEFITGKDPYGNPRNAILDVVHNNHLWVFPTDDGFGGSESADVDVSGNPLLAIVPGEKISGRAVRVNDIFRVVHDYFGHIKDGAGFRAEGEENAWQSHAAMYSPLARRAMTVETRGQNSWVNFGRFAEFNRTANGEETQYAPQKIGLLPEWASEEGRLAGENSGLPVEEQALKSARKETSTVGAAPFREGNVKNAAQYREAFNNPQYKEWRKLAQDISDALNLKLADRHETLGIFGATSTDFEPSEVLTVSGTPKQTELFGALLGALAPDVQHSVMALRYNPEGRHTEHRITFDSFETAQDFINNRARCVPTADLSFIPKTNTIVLVNDGAIDLWGIDGDYGEKITDLEERRVDQRFIRQTDYAGIVQKARHSVQRHHAGTRRENLDNFLRRAAERLGKNRPAGNEEEAGALKSARPPVSDVAALEQAVEDARARVHQVFSALAPNGRHEVLDNYLDNNPQEAVDITDRQWNFDKDLKEKFKQAVRDFTKARNDLAAHKLAAGESKVDVTPPYTITALLDEKLAGKRGKEVKLATIKQILKQDGVKKIEQEIIGEILEMPAFKGKQQFSFDEFEQAVRFSLMPLEVVNSRGYHDYGMQNVGLDAEQTATNIYNTSLEHGVVGHFPSDFNKPGEQFDYEIREVRNPNNGQIIYAAVPVGIALTEANIAENVGTASLDRGRVEDWIQQRKTTVERNKGLFGHTRTWVDGETVYLAEVQSDAFQKTDAEDLVVESYRTKFLENKLSKSSPVFETIEDLVGVEQQINDAPREIKQLYRDFRDEMARINNNLHRFAQQDKLSDAMEESGLFKELDEALLKAKEQFPNSSSTPFEAMLEARPDFVPRVNDFLADLGISEAYPSTTGRGMLRHWYDNAMRETDGTFATALAQQKEFRQIERDKIEVQKKELQAKADTPEYRQYYENQKLVQKIKKQLLKNLPIEDKQFIAHRKNYTVRLLREEIRRQTAAGMKRLLLPTPRTLALIEGYISDGDGAMPYEILHGSDDRLEQGDTISFDGDIMIVVDADAYKITAVAGDEVRYEDFDSWFESEKEYYLDEIERGMQKYEGDKMDADELNELLRDNSYYGSQIDPEDFFVVDEEGEFDFEYDLIKTKIEEGVAENLDSASFYEYIQSIGGDYWEAGGRTPGYWIAESSRTHVQTLSQPDEYEGAGTCAQR